MKSDIHFLSHRRSEQALSSYVTIINLRFELHDDLKKFIITKENIHFFLIFIC